MHSLGTVSKEIIGDLNWLYGSNLTLNSDMDKKQRYLVCMKDSHLLVHIRFKINIFFLFKRRACLVEKACAPCMWGTPSKGVRALRGYFGPL